MRDRINLTAVILTAFMLTFIAVFVSATISYSHDRPDVELNKLRNDRIDVYLRVLTNN